MAKPTIVTRAGKGAALNHTEADANFTNLQNATITVTDGTTGTAIDLNGTITFTAGSNVTITQSSGTITIASTDTGIANVVEDSTPQLGGDLDVQANIITTSTVDGNIVLAPNGAGVVELGGDAATGYDGAVLIKHNTSDGNAVIVSDTAIDLVIATDAASGTGAYIQMFAAGDIGLTSNGSTTIDGLVYPNADGTAGQFITTDGAGSLGFSSTLEGASLVDYREAPYTLTYASTITPDAANGNVQIVTLTGNVTMNALGNPVSGQSLTLIVKQDATGSRTLTSSMKFAGGDKTLTTAANSVDIITIFYDGTNYWASLGKDFK